MFKEILKIIPMLENKDLNQMERNLGSRFTKIAKKFGKGLVGALAGGGIAGLAIGLIDKLLNPLKETQDAIDRVLKQGDDIVTNAKQFGTTAGKLFKLQALAKSTGLDPESLFMLVNKFQNAVAEAKADPTKQTSVRKFVGQTDTAEAFFGFIQALQKMDKSQQLLVQQEVFGEKQTLKMADFLQTNFASQLQILKARPSEQYTPGLEKLGTLNDVKDALEARRELEDVLKKSNLINPQMVMSQNARAQLELDRENTRIGSYKALASVDLGVSKITAIIEKGALDLIKVAEKASSLNDLVMKLSVSRVFKGILGSGGGN